MSAPDATPAARASLPWALYDAFAAGPFGGAAAGIVAEAEHLSPERMQSIARHVKAPATAFIQSVGADSIHVRFFSTLTEYGMCGHGTVALATLLLESGRLSLGDDGAREMALRTGSAGARLRIEASGETPVVMLEITPSRLEACDVDAAHLAALLGLRPEDFHPSLPIERARGDFVHLEVPVRGLEAVRRIVPDFGGLAAFSRAHGLHTITAFTREALDPSHTVHCRDFAPAVGTPESPAAGTTNAALTTYLVHHRLIEAAAAGSVVVLSEQGYECGRPSLVRSEARIAGGRIESLWVGGTARRSMVGRIYLPQEWALPSPASLSA